MSEKKIGVGIVTCNRPIYLENLLNSIIPCEKYIHELVVVNDGKPIDHLDLPFGCWIDNPVNLGVAKTKNIAIKHLLDNECDYIFIIEDDMVILDPTVFEKYIELCNVSGIQHFNYGPGSPFNRKQTIQNFDLHNRHLLEQRSEPNPKLIIDYGNAKLSLFEHSAGMFSFFTRQILKEVGLLDEAYKQAWEHVSHTQQIINAGSHPPFWWFADLCDSHMYLTEAVGAIENSSIAKDTSAWMENVYRGREIYKKKHGCYPNETPLVNKDVVVSTLKEIKAKWTT